MNEAVQYLHAVYPLSDEVLSHLDSILKSRSLVKGEFLLKPGEVCENIYFIKKGLLRCYYLRGETEVSAWFMKEADVIVSVDSYYEQVPSYEYIQALEDCDLYYITFYEEDYIFQTYLEYNVIGRLLTRKYLQVWNRQLRNIRMLSAAERYQELLNKEPELLLRVPLKYLASYLDMLPETLSRMRNRISN